MLTLGFQLFGGAFDILGSRSRGIRVGLDAGNVVRDVFGALRGELGAAGDLLGGGALLLDRGRDRGSDLVHLADDAADTLDGIDRLAGYLLDIGDLLRD